MFHSKYIAIPSFLFERMSDGAGRKTRLLETSVSNISNEKNRILSIFFIDKKKKRNLKRKRIYVPHRKMNRPTGILPTGTVN